MEEYKKEKYITTSPEPVTLGATEKIINQMNNSVCRIDNYGVGTGFFTKIPYKSKLLPVLITNNHVIGKDDLMNNKIINIYINKNKISKKITLDNSRLKFTNEKLDITIIEIKENDKLNNKYLELDDEIINYFKSNQKDDPKYLNSIYVNKSIYIINYPEGKDVVVSYGPPPSLSESEIQHRCSTREGSSGSPILLINNQKLIGIHYGSSNQFLFNKGTILIYSIIEFEKIKNNLMLINNEGALIDNFIIGEFEIKEDKQKIRIINSYEEMYRNNKYFEHHKEYENELEIKQNCVIEINNKIIPFSYFYDFDKKGKYNIKYFFKNKIKKANYLFYSCNSLVNINLTYFNTDNITGISYIFFGCNSLTNINLSNFNTKNVNDMSGIFWGCSSLTNLDISNFNTNNVTDMRAMFMDCSSLAKINLSNFNMNKVKNATNLFFGCKKLLENNINAKDEILLKYFKKKIFI